MSCQVVNFILTLSVIIFRRVSVNLKHYQRTNGSFIGSVPSWARLVTGLKTHNITTTSDNERGEIEIKERAENLRTYVSREPTYVCQQRTNVHIPVLEPGSLRPLSLTSSSEGLEFDPKCSEKEEKMEINTSILTTRETSRCLLKKEKTVCVG